jgi:60 kDa SS-A/Ro ribonucleoprotein
VPKIVDALDAAFYATFQNVEPCGKPVLLALDVSGSMDGSMIAGSCLSAREASAAMALVTAATEPDCEIIAFSAAANGHGGQWGGGESGITRVTITPRMRLDSVIEKVRAIPMGGTDSALPMVWARRNKLALSGFITYTDSETWAGNIHPAQALRQYRDEFVGNAKAVVVGMTSNGFTLADPNDRGMLDVVGFDTSVPAVISDFVRAA